MFLLTLLPVFIAGGFGCYFCFGFLKADLAVLNTCRVEQLKIQTKAGGKLSALLKLNPQALRLRLEEQRAQEEVAAALETGNGFGLTAAEAHLLLVQTKRKALNGRQRTLIEQANLLFSQGSDQISRALENKWRGQMESIAPWLANRFRMLSVKTPVLSVRPDLPDVAPAYEPVPGFEEAQSWAHFWQIEVQAASWVNSFLKWKGRFDRSCATSLYPENPGWSAKLKEAKSWSKLW